jgi:hypothetical protein
VTKATPDYVLAGETPGFERLTVFDKDTGKEVTSVLEISIPAGWLVRFTGERIQGSALYATERLTGNFELRWIE